MLSQGTPKGCTRLNGSETFFRDTFYDYPYTVGHFLGNEQRKQFQQRAAESEPVSRVFPQGHSGEA